MDMPPEEAKNCYLDVVRFETQFKTRMGAPQTLNYDCHLISSESEEKFSCPGVIGEAKTD